MALLVNIGVIEGVVDVVNGKFHYNSSNSFTLTLMHLFTLAFIGTDIGNESQYVLQYVVFLDRE